MADPAPLRVGDAGTPLRVRVRESYPDGLAVDVSAATRKFVYLTDPDGTRHEYAASFTANGTDGQIQIVTALDTTAPDTVPGTLNRHGNWLIHGWVELPGGGEWTTARGSFVVAASPRFPGY